MAGEIVHAIHDVCLNMAIAGSLRRLKPEVGDVELLFCSKKELRSDGLFEKTPFDLTEDRINELLRKGVISKRLNKANAVTWGHLNKLATHVRTGIPIDLFSEPSLEDWWRSLVIRTGPADLNVRLITGCAKRGIKMHCYGVGFTDQKTGETIPCDSEKKVFELAGITYKEPQFR